MTDKQDPPEALAARILFAVLARIDTPRGDTIVDVICGLIRDHDAERDTTLEIVTAERDDARRQLSAVRELCERWGTERIFPDCAYDYYRKLSAMLAGKEAAKPPEPDGALLEERVAALERKHRGAEISKLWEIVGHIESAFGATPRGDTGEALRDAIEALIGRVVALENDVGMLLQRVRAAEKWHAMLAGKDGSE
jgi:hypothetical protein